MEEQIDQAIAAGKLTSSAGEALKKLKPGEYCAHKSWGFGRVAEWSLITGQVIVDFRSKKGHGMQAQYAAETLRHIPSDHVLAKAANDREGTKHAAAENPAAFLREVLADLSGKATVDQIGAILVPELFTAEEFKKWWDAARKVLKKDGHFAIPSKKTDPIVLRDAPVSALGELLEAFEKANAVARQLATADELHKRIEELSPSNEELLQFVARLESASKPIRRLHSAEALQLLLIHDDIAKKLELAAASTHATDILRDEEKRLPGLLEKLPASKIRRALELIPIAFPTDWTDRILEVFRKGSARTVTEAAKFLEDQGHGELLRSELQRAISSGTIASNSLYWFLKGRGGSFKEFFKPELFGLMLAGVEHDRSDSMTRASKLHDLLVDDRELINDLLAEADAEAVRNAVKRLMLSTVFEELNKRSLLARIVKLHPEAERLISGNSEEKQESMVVSWASLERRKKEYDHLVNKLIPQNIKDIEIARGYGDLRENFEFKSAKQMQAVLMRRRAETERDLLNARGTNFENPDTSRVSIGTTVTLGFADGAEETYSILGAWDSSPAHHIISYHASLGQALLGLEPGTQVDLPTETGDTRKGKVLRIEPFTQLELLSEQAVEEAELTTI